MSAQRCIVLDKEYPHTMKMEGVGPEALGAIDRLYFSDISISDLSQERSGNDESTYFSDQDDSKQEHLAEDIQHLGVDDRPLQKNEVAAKSSNVDMVGNNQMCDALSQSLQAKRDARLAKIQEMEEVVRFVVQIYMYL